jgi:phosphohistidine phosphatase
LYIMRHGPALDVGEQNIKRDAARPLSPEGTRMVTEVASGLFALRIRPSRIVASPLLRAVQTAEVVSRVLGCSAAAETSEFMAPGAAVSETIRWLNDFKADSVLLVGHMPEVAVLTSELVGGNPDVNLVFGKSAVACVTSSALPASGCGRLEWLLSPDCLRLIGKNAG